MPFDTYTKSTEIVASMNLEGRTYLITGGSSGLGKESARCLASRGAEVVLTGSSSERGVAAVTQLQAATGSKSIRFEQIRFESLRDVDRGTKSLLAQLPRLDGIIGSAGIMGPQFGLTEDGLELQFGINHIAHHHLITSLVPLLRKGQGARVVMMTSGAHRLAGVDFDDPNYQRRPYCRWDAYAQSKSANVMFAVGLDHKMALEGIRAFVVSPGIVMDTNLHVHLKEEDFAPLRERQPYLENYRRKNSEEGAAAILWSLLHPELEGCGGYYVEDCQVAFSNADPLDHLGVMPRVRDVASAYRLWDLSEQIIREKLVV